MTKISLLVEMLQYMFSMIILKWVFCIGGDVGGREGLVPSPTTCVCNLEAVLSNALHLFFDL